MRRRFNYTGRTRIFEKDIRIAVMEPETGMKEFAADLILGDYKLPPDAPVWIEAYDRYAVVRYQFGTVANPHTENKCSLAELSGTDTFHFRVKIIDPNNHSRLLGLAKNINATSPHDEDAPARSLLRLARDDLRGRPWKLEFPVGQYPILYIDNSIDAGTSLARLNIFFQAVVFPQVVETILGRILLADEYRPSSEVDDEDEWKASWIAFAETLPGVSRLETDSDSTTESLTNWIEDVVEGFSRNINAIRKIRITLKEIEA